MVKAILERSSWHFSGLVLGKVLSITLFVLLARTLLPEKLGQLVLFITIFQLVTALSNFGLKPWFQTQSPKLGESTAFKIALKSRILVLYVSIAVIATLLILAKPFTLLISLYLLIILIPESLISMAEAYWILKKQPVRVGIKNIAFFVFVFIFWGMTGFPTDLSTLTLIWLLASIINVGWFFPWREFSYKLTCKFTHKNLITLKSASAYALITATGLVYSRADQLIIQSFKGFGALGIYSAAYRLLDSINLLPQAVAENLFPEAAKPDNISLRQLLKIEAVIFLIGLLVSSLLWFSAPTLVPFVLGNEYLAAVSILSVLSFVLLLFFINAPIASVVQSSSYVKKFLPYGIGNTLLNVSLNLALVPSMGIVISAWIMVLTEFLGLLINLYFLKKVYAK